MGETMKTRARLLVVAAAMFSCIGVLRSAEVDTTPQPLSTRPQEVVATPPAAKPTAARNEPLSFGLEDVVKLVQSGAGTDVVLSYVENSPIAYSPSANDVMRMHEEGVPSDVIVAILRHGGNLRAQEKQGVQANAQATSTPPT